MEVAYEFSDAGEVVRIENRGGRALLCWNGGMGLITKREAPEIGTGEFLSATEDDSVILGKDSDGCFFFKYATVVVTQFADAHQVVMKVRHCVTSLDGGLWKEQFTSCPGNMWVDTGSVKNNLESIGVDLRTGGARGHVEFTHAGVGNDSVRLG